MGDVREQAQYALDHWTLSSGHKTLIEELMRALAEAEDDLRGMKVAYTTIRGSEDPTACDLGRKLDDLRARFAESEARFAALTEAASRVAGSYLGRGPHAPRKLITGQAQSDLNALLTALDSPPVEQWVRKEKNDG
jgi:hypothetical protein